MSKLSPDGRSISVVENLRTRIQRLDGTSFILQTDSIEWSPDSQFVAGFSYCCSEPLTIWRVSNGETVRELDKKPTYGQAIIAWSPDSRRIAIGRNDSVIISSIFEARQPVVLLCNKPQHITWSFDGQFVAVTYQKGKTLQVWRTNASASESLFYDKGRHGRMIWSPTKHMLCGQTYWSNFGTLIFDKGHLFGLSLVPTDCAQEKGMAWSPDGSMTIYKATPNRMTILEAKLDGCCFQIPLDVDYVKHKVDLLSAQWTADSKSVVIFYLQNHCNLIVQVYRVGDQEILREFLLPNHNVIEEVKLFGSAFVVLGNGEQKQRVFALDLWKSRMNTYFPPVAKRLIFTLMCVCHRLLSSSACSRSLPALPLEMWLIVCEFLFVEVTQSLDHLRG
jgi:hypothetical protein